MVERPTRRIARSAATSPTLSITAATSSTERVRTIKPRTESGRTRTSRNPSRRRSVTRAPSTTRLRSTSFFRFRSSSSGCYRPLGAAAQRPGRSDELVEPSAIRRGSGDAAVVGHRAAQREHAADVELDVTVVFIEASADRDDAIVEQIGSRRTCPCTFRRSRRRARRAASCRYAALPRFRISGRRPRRRALPFAAPLFVTARAGTAEPAIAKSADASIAEQGLKSFMTPV